MHHRTEAHASPPTRFIILLTHLRSPVPFIHHPSSTWWFCIWVCVCVCIWVSICFVYRCVCVWIWVFIEKILNLLKFRSWLENDKIGKIMIFGSVMWVLVWVVFALGEIFCMYFWLIDHLNQNYNELFSCFVMLWFECCEMSDWCVYGDFKS